MNSSFTALKAANCAGRSPSKFGPCQTWKVLSMTTSSKFAPAAFRLGLLDALKCTVYLSFESSDILPFTVSPAHYDP